MVRRLIASGLMLMVLAAGCGRAGQAPDLRDAKAGSPAAGAPSSGRTDLASTPPAQTSPQSATPGPRCTVPAPEAKPGQIAVQVYFTCEDDPDHPRPVTRHVPATDAVLHAALTELLKGPTDAEKAAGLHSWFSSETAGMLREVRIHEGMAHVDFKNFQQIIPNASTSAGSGQLLGEVGRTIFQFKSITQADIRFDGSCQAFWGWLQRDCQVLYAEQYRRQK